MTEKVGTIIQMLEESKSTEIRRPYFPMYDDKFSLWMSNKFICEQFLKVFANDGRPVELIGEPSKQTPVNLGNGVKGVRFDVTAKQKIGRGENCYRICAIDSQLKFYPESYAKRMVYYSIMAAVGLNALNKGEDYEKLRPVTIIFIFVDNNVSPYFMNVIKHFDISDMIVHGANTQPFDDSIALIAVNLNNKGKIIHNNDDMYEADIRTFADIMSQGDDPYIIDNILKDSKISTEMREVAQLFRDIMDKKIMKLPISKRARDPEVQEILKGDAFNMSSMTLAREEGRSEGLQEGKKEVAKRLLIRGYEIIEVAECTGVSLEDVKALRDKLQEPTIITDL